MTTADLCMFIAQKQKQSEQHRPVSLAELRQTIHTQLTLTGSLHVTLS